MTPLTEAQVAAGVAAIESGRDPRIAADITDRLALVAKQAGRLVALADALGVVVTIEQQPRLPLAMGNY